jgi:hypothetical protein
MIDEPVDVLLSDLRTALAVDPSPAFPARVRAAVEDHPMASSVWGWPLRLAMAGIVSAGSVAVVWLTLARAPSAPLVTAPPPLVADAGVTSLPAPHVADAAPAVTAPEPARSARVRPLHVERITTIVARYDGMDVIVPLDQAAAIGRLLGGVAGRRIVVPAERTVVIDALRPLPELAAIQIPLITIEPLVADDDEGGVRREP